MKNLSRLYELKFFELKFFAKIHLSLIYLIAIKVAISNINYKKSNINNLIETIIARLENNPPSNYNQLKV
jgi:hypothetical protein